MRLYLDIETRSESPIQAGLYRYAETAQVLILSWAVDESLVQTFELPEWKMLESTSFGRLWTDPSVELWAHNAEFERVVLLMAGFPPSRGDRWHCTMQLARASGLPGGLGELCAIHGLPWSKSKEGEKVIKKLAGGLELSVEEKAALIARNQADVEMLRALAGLLPDTHDRIAMLIDRMINHRGFAVDIDLAKAAVALAKREAVRRDFKTGKLTNGRLESVRQVEKLKSLLAENGTHIESLSAGKVSDLLNASQDELTRELLELRRDESKTSTSKYAAVLKSVCKDGRLRGTMVYHAAHTGRWAGSLFQPQNLARTSKEYSEKYEETIAAIKRGDRLEDPMSALKNCVRGLVIPSPGKRLGVYDFSNIESRVLAWMAGERWKLEAYMNRDDDPENGRLDLYNIIYSRMFGVSLDTVAADNSGEMRFIGKMLELACGYQGSVGALNNIAGIHGRSQFDEADAVRYVQAWRRANPAIVNFWHSAERAMKLCVRSRTEVRAKSVMFVPMDSRVGVRLPSGRLMCYFRPRLEDGVLVYDAPVRGKLIRTETYGGKIVENIVQAVARDILVAAMSRITFKHKARIVLHVHDEIVCEVENETEFRVLEECIKSPPAWADSILPIHCSSQLLSRYRK